MIQGAEPALGGSTSVTQLHLKSPELISNYHVLTVWSLCGHCQGIVL